MEQGTDKKYECKELIMSSGGLIQCGEKFHEEWMLKHHIKIAHTSKRSK